MYEVFIGTYPASSDLKMSYLTIETNALVTSKRLQHPSPCYVTINAISPAGEYQPYHETIHI